MLCKASGYCTGETALPLFSHQLMQVALEYEQESLKKQTADTLQGRQIRYPVVKLPVGHGNLITGVDFVLPPAASISGRVVDPRGNNYLSPEEEKTSSTYIYLKSDKVIQEFNKNPLNPEPQPFPLPRGVPLGKGSCFKFENVPDGAYRFSISTNRLNENTKEQMIMKSRSGEVTVREGEALQDVTVVVESRADFGGITGHVVDAWTGEPVKSLAVRVLQVESPEEPNPQKGFPLAKESDEYRDATGPVRSPGDTNLPDGDFTVTNVSPGKVTLALLASGYQTVQTEVQVSSGQTTEQTFKLGEGGKLSGRVLDAETNEPIKKFEVKVTQADGEKKGQPVEGKVQMDKDTTGTFCLTVIPAGRLSLEVDENTAPPNSYKKESTH
jgi:5-hydroxyisourate hydrolase-like protein (transthyretin family)